MFREGILFIFLLEHIRSNLRRPDCNEFTQCRSRCGSTISPPYSCACDSSCSFFGDCCKDYTEECTQDILPSILQSRSSLFSCRTQGSTGKYALSHCPQNTSPDCPHSLLCELITDPPAFHPIWKLFFKNQFCVLCWVEQNVTEELKLVLDNHADSRICVPDLKECSKTSGSNYLRKKCNSYIQPILVQMYVGEELVESVYRNIDCFVQLYVDE
ncbi:uncharacterized protein LOC111708766 [Eurytemora carolleeae]|uniref:uncharacterized protein LOC111708766 n=1 Tax=Eurytemora carolleeae TaxID=1294199 RepID=UPI000C793B21|nr:uncharacterized protein LOC111708766 [Eurytemora carolleeae]|eukprot:XP_023338003.1 uncharacterized protein LOC111708766 [Eurytemora affinis]